MNELNIPRDLEYAAIQSRLDYMKARHAKDDEILNRLKQIQEEYTRELHDFLGPKSDEYKAFYEKRREDARSMQPQFKPTPEGGKSEIEFKKKRLSEADEFIKNLGVNVNDIKSIRNKYQQEFRQVVGKDTELTNSKKEGL